jgi:hypothetical protein
MYMSEVAALHAEDMKPALTTFEKVFRPAFRNAMTKGDDRDAEAEIFRRCETEEFKYGWHWYGPLDG